jgi:hypothetical protein
MTAKKALKDEAFSITLSGLNAILNILGVRYSQLGEVYYGYNNTANKMYRYCWRKMEIPIQVINTLIKIVGERSYRIAWEKTNKIENDRKNKTVVPLPVVNPPEPIQASKKEEAKVLVPKAMDKPQEPIKEQINSSNIKEVTNSPIISESKPKRKYKKRTKKIVPIKKEKENITAKNDLQRKSSEPIQDTKKSDPVKPNLQDTKKEITVNPDTNKNLFYKIGKPLTDFNLKK